MSTVLTTLGVLCRQDISSCGLKPYLSLTQMACANRKPAVEVVISGSREIALDCLFERQEEIVIYFLACDEVNSQIRSWLPKVYGITYNTLAFMHMQVYLPTDPPIQLIRYLELGQV